MLRSASLAAAAAALATLLTPGDAAAWGAAHVGYTHVGPNGVYHAGRTAAYGPSGYHYGGSEYGRGYGGYGGAYHYGATGAAGAYHYGGGYAGGYRYATPSGAYGTGVYRRW